MNFHYYTLLFTILLASCEAKRIIGSISRRTITVDLIHRDSPHSPSYDPTKTRFDLLSSAFDRSTTRQSSLNLRKTTAAFPSGKAMAGLSAPITSNGGEYLMKIGIGTPPIEILAIADTGSDLTWTQCQPCSGCYDQQDPLFDPRGSSTYRATSTIMFGPGSSVDGPGVVSTPLVKKEPPTFYYLTLEGVSVGTGRASPGPEVEEGNIIIDSGTTLTFLPPEIYGRLEDEVAGAVKGRRVEGQRGMFGLCYEKEEGFRAPPMVANFRGGAAVELPAESTFLEVEEGVLCLTLVPARGEIAIFGNLHQMNYRVGYDIDGGKVDFLRTDCGKEG
ncbi:eukaryotic aspartyl protease family protein [Striga asiatica]|uniref:Eukaryotic aspartyl protease family protein n=1 Tax=Striga asiatica TaxID=4170 RepID=A0A5A7PC23_STRAF|nr:eukaryotic aspartyl protease family protein [Striga asiatica]